ncbi:MAG: hypothetical protein ACR2LS_05225 [Thermomicrobiales bacterium]
MEYLVILLIVLLLVGIAGGGFLLRDFGQRVLERDTRTTVETVQARAEANAEQLRGELRTLASEYQAQLGRLRERNTELEHLATRFREQADTSAAAQLEAAAAKEDVARLRKELDTRLEGLSTASTGSDGPRAAGVAAIADLYGRLARVEASLAALTNPILLPGEPYSVPDELVPDALKWDNWKEVGETAYALGEQFNLARIQLSRDVVDEMGSCITTIRSTLTTAIYPNLDTTLSPERTRILREGLSTIAESLSTLRQRLETNYRSMTGIKEPSHD